MNLKTFWELIKATFQEFAEDKAARLAAALAYYTVFSLAPLLVIVVGIAGIVVSSAQVQEMIIAQIQGLAGSQAATMVGEMLDNFNRPEGGFIAIAVGVVTLLFGATGVFGQLQDALNTIWEVQPKPNRGLMGIIKDRFLSFTMILGLSFLLMVSLVVSAGLAGLGTFFGNVLPFTEFILQLINQIISIVVITILFALIFKVLPDAEIAWRDVIIGAFVTSLLFNLGKFALGYYLGNSAVASGYGAAGSLIVILLWVYYSSQILFLGAEFTQVYARRFGSRIQPSENAERVTETERNEQGMPRRKDSAGPQTGEALGGALIPVVDQPPLRAGSTRLPGAAREKVRYEPPNPASVVPVIALGAAASMLTISKLVRVLIETVQEKTSKRKHRLW